MPETRVSPMSLPDSQSAEGLPAACGKRFVSAGSCSKSMSLMIDLILSLSVPWCATTIVFVSGSVAMKNCGISSLSPPDLRIFTCGIASHALPHAHFVTLASGQYTAREKSAGRRTFEVMLACENAMGVPVASGPLLMDMSSPRPTPAGAASASGEIARAVRRVRPNIVNNDPKEGVTKGITRRSGETKERSRETTGVSGKVKGKWKRVGEGSRSPAAQDRPEEIIYTDGTHGDSVGRQGYRQGAQYAAVSRWELMTVDLSLMRCRPSGAANSDHQPCAWPNVFSAHVPVPILLHEMASSSPFGIGSSGSPASRLGVHQ